MISNLTPFAGTALLGTALAGSLYFAVTSTPETGQFENAAPPPTDQSVPSGDSFSLPVRRPDLYYQAIRERPLFAPTRRVIEPVEMALDPEPVPEPVETTAVEALPEPAEPQPSFRLLGVMTTSDNGRALIAIGDTAAAWFAEDEEIQGWRITSVTSGAITLAKDEQVIDLEIYAQ